VPRRFVRTALTAAAAAAVVAVAAHSAAGPQQEAAVPSWADVAPIFAAKCAGCHSSRGIAPFSLTTAREAAANADAILAATRTGEMPPWLPGSDSPAYVGQSQRRLTPSELSLIARWVRRGAPSADGGPITAPPSDMSAAGSTIALEPAKPYLPRPALGGLDDYHCFLLEPHLTHDVFVRSAVVRPQNAGIVHHVILFQAAGQNAADARRLNRESGGDGWTCFGGPGLSETHAAGAAGASSDSLGGPQWISAWVPGHTADDLPRGTGVLLRAGAAIVMQVHYNLIHRARPDRSQAVLRVVPAAGSALTPLDTMLLPAPVELPCPTGSRSRLCSRAVALAQEARTYGPQAAMIPLALLYLCHRALPGPASTSTTCERPVTRPIRIYGVAGHMHLRGVDIRLDLDPGTPAAKTLLHIPAWNFHWQDAYYLAQPVDAGPGDTIRVTCRFDNGARRQPIVNGKRLPPRYVLWGEGTTDEMCLGLLQVAAR
jgi:mono/diheme cytochrome c family protein